MTFGYRGEPSAAVAALPLAGIRVLDVSQVMAGPFCSMLLGDLGADVIKVEPPGGDQTRGAMGFRMKGDDSLGFINLNRNKRSIALDLRSDAGREVFYRLVESADILVENYRPGALRRLKCDYDTLANINPRLIYASISGFGQSGPWAGRPGFDLMAQAMSGIMAATGHEGGPPTKAGVPVADIGCGLFATYAILSAYIGRQATGRGNYIDASLFDAALAFSVWDAADYWGTGVLPKPLGTSNKMSAPYQAFRARDGHFVMGATNQKLWVKLCAVIERPDLLDRPEYADVPARLAHRDVLARDLEATFATRDVADWVELLLGSGVPAGPIYNYAEAFASEHARQRGMRMDIDHPVEGAVPNIGFAVKLRDNGQTVRRHPPLLGEHTAEILAEAGLERGAVQALRERGAFGG
jgi:crotonobetainyl-CoA:carnitine CoA-transferase CaiB-like acyl-CoA transferase